MLSYNIQTTKKEQYMHKLIIMAAAIAAGAWTAVSAPLNPDTCTADEVRAVIADSLATNYMWDAFERLRKGGVFAPKVRERHPDVWAELDAALAQRKFFTGLAQAWRRPATWPVCSAADQARTGADVAYAATYDIARRRGCDLPSDIHAGCDDWTLDEIAVWLSDVVSFPEKCALAPREIAGVKQWLQTTAVRVIRLHIRAQGKSFITKNGVNPCESYMTSLTTALNAPRFAGLDEWLKGVGCKGIDLSRMPTEECVAQLKTDILNGDKHMTDYNRGILLVCLGVDGYNAFVREYNGE